MSDNITHYYEATGARYRMSSTRRERVLRVLDQALARCNDEAVSLLDIGIGSGEVAEHCRAVYLDRTIELIGTDISRPLLMAHRNRYTDIVVTNVDSEGWTASFPKPFDIVVASELVEHLFRPDVFFTTVRDILKPGGYMVISTPNMLLWSQRIKFFLGRHAWSDGGVFEWGHIHLFSWKFLQEQFARNGFSIVATDHLLHPNYLHPLRRFLPPGLFAFQFIVLVQKK